MDSNIEKYYNYIVNDIYNNTIIKEDVGDEGYYKFPFDKNVKYRMSLLDLSQSFSESGTILNLFVKFIIYCDEFYVTNTSDSFKLWDMYVKKIINQ